MPRSFLLQSYGRDLQDLASLARDALIRKRLISRAVSGVTVQSIPLFEAEYAVFQETGLFPGADGIYAHVAYVPRDRSRINLSFNERVPEEAAGRMHEYIRRSWKA